MLKSKPGKTFKCPACGYSAPFNIVLSGQDDLSMKVTNTDNPPLSSSSYSDKVLSSHDKTRIVESLQGKTTVDTSLAGSDDGEKTKLVLGLQRPKQWVFHVSFGNVKGVINLPSSGQFTLGRNSSDSTAQIKLTPDAAMSRVHAGMRVISQQGQPAYQVTSIKTSNPVYINGITIPKGKPYTLKAGDMLQMGETKLIFKVKQ